MNSSFYESIIHLPAELRGFVMSASGEQTALATGWPGQKEIVLQSVRVSGDPNSSWLDQHIKKSKKISNFVPVPLGLDAGKTHMTALPPGAGESCSHSLC